MVAVALQSQTHPKNEQFYKLTPEELKQDYKSKRINAEAYLNYLIKAKRGAGWEWRINVKEFCSEWEIAERTFYWALSKLKVRNEISWRSGDNTIVLWWDKKVAKIANVDSSDLVSSPNPDIVMAPQDVAEALQDVAEALQDVADKNVKTLAVAELCNSSYSLQIDSKKNTDFKEKVCVFLGEGVDEDPEFGQQSIHHHHDEINQDAIPGSRTTLLNDAKREQLTDTTTHEGQGSAPPKTKNDEINLLESRTALLNNTKTLQVANTTSPEGQSSAAPIRRTSQKQEWICPGTEDEKNEFLIFKGGLLVAEKKCKPVEARTAALGWANRNPEAANLLWDDWQREKVQDANQNTAIETVPEFRRMHEQEHVAVLEKFINFAPEEFLKLCWWHEHWLTFASRRLGQELIPGLTPEIIKQIKQAVR
ncbi:MAG: hypothetical protein FWK04_29595 [Nostoc sp. GBBB01]|nr:hypothetical protein [Nostoc sp. GBBB01]